MTLCSINNTEHGYMNGWIDFLLDALTQMYMPHKGHGTHCQVAGYSPGIMPFGKWVMDQVHQVHSEDTSYGLHVHVVCGYKG